MSNSNYIKNILGSIINNYKSWLLMILSCIILKRDENSILYSMFEYIMIIVWIYIFHRLSHMNNEYDLSSIFNLAHIYHHNNSNKLSTIIEVILEILGFFMLYVISYYVMCLVKKCGYEDISKRIEYIIPSPFTILFFNIFYTLTHNINYGILNVNKLHSYHHLYRYVNYGPDICDIVFKTKYPENSIEDTDHYIPNILISTIIVYIIKRGYESSQNKEKLKRLFMMIYLSLGIIFIVFTVDEYFKMKEKKNLMIEYRILIMYMIMCKVIMYNKEKYMNKIGKDSETFLFDL